jgi:hypothetical protein
MNINSSKLYTMKKLIGIFALTLFVGMAGTANAQSKVKEAEQDVKHSAKTVGHKSAEIASKGKARITDQRYKDKVGPNGQTIYVDNHSRYYWIDKKGHRQYVTEAELKDKM